MEQQSSFAAEASADFPIVIIGSGFGGIGAAIQLQKAGIDSFTIFERAGEIGGTWRDNTYPGAACDVPSHVYSFSFEPNPDWSRKYSPSQEIQAYLLHCVEKHGLRRHLRLNTAITSAVFDETSGRWTLTTGAGEKVEARVAELEAALAARPAPDVAALENAVSVQVWGSPFSEMHESCRKLIAGSVRAVLSELGTKEKANG